MRLIDADEVGLSLTESIRCVMCVNPMHTDKGCDGNCMFSDEKLLKEVTKEIERIINSIPTVEPKKGKWEFLDRTDIDGLWYDKCSECGFIQEQDALWLGAIPPYDYCPGCGAYMRDKKKVEGANK